MTEAEVLQKVKKQMGLSGNDYQDDTIMEYIMEVKNVLLDAGVLKEVVNSSVAAGCIARGVLDLWNYGSGNAGLSPYFYQRATQLSFKTKEELPENRVSEGG